MIERREFGKSSFSFVKSDKFRKINRITDDNWDPTLYFESYTPLLGSARVKSGQNIRLSPASQN